MQSQQQPQNSTLQRIEQQIDDISHHEHVKSVQKINNYAYHIVYHPSQTQSIYKEKTYNLELMLPTSYPQDPPSLKFLDPIYHLNVGLNSGEIRMSVLQDDWSPFLSLTSLIESLDKILEEPDQQYALNADVLDEYQNKRDNYFNKVLKHVSLSDVVSCDSGDKKLDENQLSDQNASNVFNGKANDFLQPNSKLIKKSEILVKNLRESMQIVEEDKLLNEEKMKLQREIMSGGRNSKQDNAKIIKIENMVADQTNKSPPKVNDKVTKKPAALKINTAQSFIQQKQQQKSPKIKQSPRQKPKPTTIQPISLEAPKNGTLHRINETISIFIQQLSQIQKLIQGTQNSGIKSMLRDKYDAQLEMLKQLMQMSQDAKRKIVRKLKDEVSKM